MLATMNKVINILENHNNTLHFEWKELPHIYNNYNYSWYSDYGWNDYAYNWNCEICGKEIKNCGIENETEFGEVICKECASKYGYHNCEECGILTDSLGHYCRDCNEEHKHYDCMTLFDEKGE